MLKVGQYMSENPLFTPAVVGFMVQDGNVLLGLRKVVSLGLGLHLIAGVGGKIGDEPELADETTDEALQREFTEEINVLPLEYKKVGRVRFIWTHKPKRNQDVSIYLISKWQGEPKETEVIKPEWYDFNTLPKEQMWVDNVGDTDRDIVGWVPLILSGVCIDAVYVYGEDENVIAYDLQQMETYS